MVNADVVIKNAKVWTTSRTMIEGGLAIRDGEVVALAKSSHLPQSDRVIDAKGKIVVPGAIDGHVHIYEPWEREDRQAWLAASDIIHDTRGAAKGGTTTVLDMPVTQPLILNLAAFNFKRSVWERKSYVDFGLHGGFVPNLDFENIKDMWKNGATGFKTFLCFSTPEWPTLEDGELLEFLNDFSKIKALPLIHAENDSIISYNGKRLEKEGRKDFGAHLDWRPPIAEFESVRRVSFYLAQTGSSGLFVHLSLPESIEEIYGVKQKGYSIYAETCPQYLFLTSDDVLKKGPWRKCAPPLRNKERVAMMWENVRAGRVDLIGSDHAPYTKEQKEAGIENIWNAPNGMPGIETMYPLMLSAVSEGKISIGNVVQLLSENPARIYGLYPKKGNLQVGADADVVIVDMNAEEKICEDTLEMKCGWSPYEGVTLHAVPVMTMIRGEIVMENRKIVEKEGTGKFTPRQHKDRSGRRKADRKTP